MPKQSKCRTVRQTIELCLKRGLSNADALAAVKKAHPHSKITGATVNWYRNQLRRDGSKIPANRDCR